MKVPTVCLCHQVNICLKRLITNLLDNAIKYSSSDPIKISIVAKRFENEISVVFNDNGRGIPEEHQSRIFDKFYRVPDLSEGINGLGIGLYYVKTILKSLKGKIELLNTSAEGSSFRISLSTAQIHE